MMAALVDRFAKDRDAYIELRALWADDPVRYARERLGLKPTWQQRSILDAIAAPGAKVSVRSGHGIGKSGSTAAAVAWFLETRDYAKVPCTAPTSAQLRDILWSELAKWIRHSDNISRRHGIHPAFWFSSLFTVTRDRVYDPSAKGEWFAAARTSGRDNPDALQGFHASDVEVSEDGRTLARESSDGDGNIMFVVDEASGVFEAVFEVAEGALSSHGARLLMLGNPTKTKGYFADSHRHSRAHFTTLHFKSADSPLVDPQYRERLVRKYGEGSNVVMVRADGDFPKQDDDVLISIEDTEAAITREPYNHEHEPILLGVDVARFGSDRTCFVVRQGRDILHIEVMAKKDTMAVAGHALKIKEQFKVKKIFVDANGVGGGVADRLREQRQPVIDVQVGTKAPHRPRGIDAQGVTLRDYLWLEVADWVSSEQPSFAQADSQLANDLAGELASTKYGLHSSGATVIESKEKMKKRLGNSPDIADALGCTFAGATGGSEIFIG